MNLKKEDYQMQTSSSVNEVREARENKMMSKAELARKAGVTVQTIDRIEKGYECRLATKRKIILALGYELAERTKIFKGSDDPQDESEASENLENGSSEGPASEILEQGDRVRILRKTDIRR
jgi:DNA-binding XRE family transcriptional regulator